MNDIPYPYQNLANAIVLQAVADYRLTNDPRDLEEIERFFRSEWFGMLTGIDPKYLISKLRSEKSPAKRVFSEEDDQRNEHGDARKACDDPSSAAFGTPAGSETIWSMGGRDGR